MSRSPLRTRFSRLTTGRSRVATAAAVVAVASSGLVIAGSGAAHATTEPIGMNFGGQYLANLVQETPAQQDATFDDLTASGINSIRMDASFPSVEATPGTFSFNSTGMVTEAIKDGLSVDLILDYVPNWARMADGSPQPAAYATYAAKTVAHFAPLGVHTFELGNEENLPNGATPVNPADYTRLLAAAYPAIKLADPTSTVLLGGLANANDGAAQLSSYTFLKDVYADGGGADFDGVAAHLSSSPVAPMTPASWNPFYNLPNLHQVSVAAGHPDTPIWITEYGAATGGTTYTRTPSEQASDMVAAFQQAQKWSWVHGFYFFEWQDNQSDGGLWGVTTATGAPKPALNALRNLFGKRTSEASVPMLVG